MEELNNITALETLATSMGLDSSMARFLPIAVEVELLDDTATKTVLAGLTLSELEEAAGPITDSGLPRMLKLSAWIAHAGAANRNGDAFVAEDLQAVVEAGLFEPPYIAMVDFNHDFFPYGAWFSAKYEFDPKAGEFGIRAEGTMFAWRFPEMADKILAEQSRHGSVAVSMACIAQGLEFRPGNDGRDETVLRKPVFLAVSILDVPPADPNARAVGTENEDSTEEERLRDLNKALFSIHDADSLNKWVMEVARKSKIAKASQTLTQEDKMDVDKIIAQLKEAMGDTATELVAELREAVAEAARVPSLEATIVEMTTTVTTLEANLVTALEQLSTKDAEVEAANTALEAKSTELLEITEKYDALMAENTDREEQEEAARQASVREERLAKLPESYAKVLEARAEEAKEKVIVRLVEMSDEEFENELELISAGSSKASYGDRSRLEGGLSSNVGSGSHEHAIDQFVN